MSLLVLIFAPLVASLVQIFVGRRLPRGGDWVSVAGLAISWLIAVSLFVPVFFLHHPVPDLAVSIDWAGAGNDAWQLGFALDPLAIVTIFMVTTVSLLVHIFSIGYMHGNPLYSRFFAEISFFTFAMLVLVASDNLFFLFLSWELMGLCSYLLIGFYSWAPECGYDRETPKRAAIKAFLTTRVGDAAFFVAIAILFAATGHFTFAGIHEAIAAGAVSPPLLLAAALLILLGAIGKSAQFPLHVWLPDAMEGPSPVSALIHAATMVAAGIYLVGRSVAAGIFPPEALMAVAFTGSFTAIFAASMALAANDFKKVLAYSTISQLGFMLAAIGVGGWTAGFFHLTTHAFFKALLFLGSGSVLHAVHTRDMREMGGLRTKMPITYATMLIGGLALAGFPGFSGFFSKDAILAAALASGMEHGGLGYLPFIFLITAAALTAFYTFRMIFQVFHGMPRDAHRHAHAHESPATMTVPLIILAVLAVSSGWGWLRHPYEALVVHGGLHAGAHHSAHTIAMILSVIVGLGGIGLAALVYLLGRIDPAVFTRGTVRGALHHALLQLWWIDDLYALLVRGVIRLANGCGLFDRHVIDRIVDACGPGLVDLSRVSGMVDQQGVDGVVNAIGDGTRFAGDRVRLLQTGRIQDYILGLMTALLLLIVWVTR